MVKYINNNKNPLFLLARKVQLKKNSSIKVTESNYSKSKGI